MIEVVRTAFRRTVKFLPAEFALMPFSRWNESVLRYYFCRSLAERHPKVQQFVECDKIDLVISQLPLRAFIEFKFYRRPVRFDSEDMKARGFKGGPGRKNLGEFQKCIDKLHGRPYTSALSKYIVLLYGDEMGKDGPNLRFSHHYDEYSHPRDDVPLRLVEASEPIETEEAIVKAQLYEIGFGNT